MLIDKYKEDFKILKKDGSEKGQCQAMFTEKKIIIGDIKTNIKEEDIMVRTLSNGDYERFYITEVSRYEHKLGSMKPHIQVKFTKKPPQHPIEKNIQSINFHGTQTVQIGDNNIQNITNIFDELIQKIDASEASETEKLQAKSLLKQFLSHPLVSSILGAAIGLLK